MRPLSAPFVAAVLYSTLFSSLSHAQTFSKCNPLTQSCPADPALGGSTQIDFTSGPSSDFTPSGNGVSYSSSGAQLTVSASGDNPTLSSKWYLMFGHVDMTFKAAPGVGMVSSAILISDDLDEIDWELLGADASQGQTNYFGKGITGTFSQGSFVAAPSSQSDFNTYSIDWTSERILWQLNGATVRSVFASDAGDQYPQTPMQLKIGSWAGGDASNAPGTITWAGGPINYYDGPYTMQVQSVSATDYSTGSSYQYSGTDGSWEEVQAIGGSVKSGGGVAAPAVTPSPGSITPFATPTGAPAPPTASYLSSLGYVISSATSASHRHSSHSQSSLPSSSAAPPATGCETLIEYNQRGFLYTMTAPSGWHKTYNNEGVLVTPPPCATASVASATKAVDPPPVTNAGAAAAIPTTLAKVPVSPVFSSGASSVAPAPTRVKNAAAPSHTKHADIGSKPGFVPRPHPQPFVPGNGGLRTTATFSLAAAAACAVVGFAQLL